MYVPYGWGHALINEEESVGWAQRFVWRHSLAHRCLGSEACMASGKEHYDRPDVSSPTDLASTITAWSRRNHRQDL
jgi:hypothetical protein